MTETPYSPRQGGLKSFLNQSKRLQAGEVGVLQKPEILISTGAPSSWLQLSHYLFKAKDLEGDKDNKTSSAIIPPASRIPLLLPCFGAFADPMVTLTCPGCDTNSSLLVM